MLKKVCPHCGRDSYSATDRGRWVCPYCQRDITTAPVESSREGTGQIESSEAVEEP